MRQTLSVLIPLMLIIALVLNQVLPADAAKKNVKKKGISQEVLQDYTTRVNNLTKKVYERELFTPEDSKGLIELKLQLDEQMDTLPESTLAPIYFKLGNIYKLRGSEKEAIVCYQTILENFSDTAYGPKARDILTQMGVEIRLPVEEEDEEPVDNQEKKLEEVFGIKRTRREEKLRIKEEKRNKKIEAKEAAKEASEAANRPNLPSWLTK